MIRNPLAIGLLVLACALAGCGDNAAPVTTDQCPDGAVVPAIQPGTATLVASPGDDLTGRRVLKLEEIRDAGDCALALSILQSTDHQERMAAAQATAFMRDLNDDYVAAHGSEPRESGPVAVTHAGEAWLFSAGYVV